MKNTNYVIVNNRIESLPISLSTYGIKYNQNKCKYERGGRESHLFKVLSGKGCYIADGVKKEVKSGEMLFFKANVPIEYFPLSDDFTVNFITFKGFAGLKIIELYKMPNICSFTDEVLDNDFTGIFELIEKKADQEEISVALYAFVMRMARCCGTVGTTAFEKAVKYIENRYYKDISVEDIAKNVNISESALFKYFKKHLNTTPIAYLNSLRITMAKYLLKNEPQLSVESVSQSVGYNFRTYFIECFKKETGITPMQFKKERL